MMMIHEKRTVKKSAGFTEVKLLKMALRRLGFTTKKCSNEGSYVKRKNIWELSSTELSYNYECRPEVDGHQQPHQVLRQPTETVSTLALQVNIHIVFWII